MKLSKLLQWLEVLNVGGYPGITPGVNPLWIAQGCEADFGPQAAFYVNAKERCGCSSGSCGTRHNNNDYTSYQILPKGMKYVSKERIEKLGKGYCKDYKYLNVGRYPEITPGINPLVDCASRCEADFGPQAAFYVNAKERCGCSKGSCGTRVSHNDYTSYQILPKGMSAQCIEKSQTMLVPKKQQCQTFRRQHLVLSKEALLYHCERRDGQIARPSVGRRSLHLHSSWWDEEILWAARFPLLQPEEKPSLQGQLERYCINQKLTHRHRLDRWSKAFGDCRMDCYCKGYFEHSKPLTVSVKQLGCGQ